MNVHAEKRRYKIIVCEMNFEIDDPSRPIGSKLNLEFIT